MQSQLGPSHRPSDVSALPALVSAGNTRAFVCWSSSPDHYCAPPRNRDQQCGSGALPNYLLRLSGEMSAAKVVRDGPVFEARHEAA